MTGAREVEAPEAPTGAPSTAPQHIMALEGVPLHFTDDALRAIAREALKRGTGARSLRSIVERIITPVMFEVPSMVRADRTPAGVIVTREVVRKKLPAKIVEGRDEWEEMVQERASDEEEDSRKRATV